jgi:hypothetical protein
MARHAYRTSVVLQEPAGDAPGVEEMMTRQRANHALIKKLLQANDAAVVLVVVVSNK